MVDRSEEGKSKCTFESAMIRGRVREEVHQETDAFISILLSASGLAVLRSRVAPLTSYRALERLDRSQRRCRCMQ